MQSSQDRLSDARKAAAYHAVDTFIKNGMVVGLGTGRTATFAVERLGGKLKSGELSDITGIATSEATRQKAIDCGIPLTTLEENHKIDVALDGADEVDPAMNLVKGRGGALLRERMVEECAKVFVVMVDETKLAPKGLGSLGVIPVEITSFGWQHIAKQLQKCETLATSSIKLHIKENGEPFVTDNHNYILNITLKEMGADVFQMDDEISKVTGVVHHGLFLNMATHCIVSKMDGSVTNLEK